MKVSKEFTESAVLHGCGIICTRALAEGEAVFELTGRLVSVPSMHTLQIAENVHLEPGDSAWAMINHSCAPNCIIDINRKRVVTCRDIRPGEELTFNYLTTEWEMASPFPCRCGAAHCFGMIRGYRFLDASQRQALRATVAPHFLLKPASCTG